MSTSRALTIQTSAQLVSLTKAQQALLILIRKCIAKKQTLTLELIVEVYYNNVRKKCRRDLNYDWDLKRYTAYQELDILEEFKNTTSMWTYTLRPLIRGWFTSNVGILVIKNKLIIIPTIDV